MQEQKAIGLKKNLAKIQTLQMKQIFGVMNAKTSRVTKQHGEIGQQIIGFSMIQIIRWIEKNSLKSLVNLIQRRIDYHGLEVMFQLTSMILLIMDNH